MVVSRGGITPNRFDQLMGYNHYTATTNNKRDFIFECHLTVDDRYFIMHDEVFDVQEQTSLGNIWDSMDVFKTIFKNIQIDNPEYKQIQEGWASLPILEGSNNLHDLRDFLLEWSFFDDTWVGRKMKSAGEGIADFASTSWEGIKKMGIAISKGDWSEILSLLGKGVLYVLRKLKEAAYSTIGMIVDAILVATGIGKIGQIVVWGLITSLDVYQLLSNDWPDEEQDNPLWMKLMDLGFDLLGLVFAGVAAKGAKSLFKGSARMGSKALAKTVGKNKAMRGVLEKIISAGPQAAGKLRTVQSKIIQKWPSGAKFIGSILGGLGKMITKLVSWCKSIITLPGKVAGKLGAGARTQRGVVAGTGVGTLLYGTEKLFGHGENEPSQNNGEEDVIKAIQQNKPSSVEYDENDI